MASSQRARSLALVLALCAASWVGVCALADRAADWAEADLGAHLWREEEWMLLFEPSRYRTSARRTLHVLGPSESREAFWPEAFRTRAKFDGFLNDSLSFSTLDDAVTQLEYVERAYGEDAIGDVLVLALAPRFTLGHAPGERPLPIAIDRYSSLFSLDETSRPQQLVRKSRPEAALARLRLAAHSSARFRATVASVRAWLGAHGSRQQLEKKLLVSGLVDARYAMRAPHDKAQYYEWSRSGSGLYAAMRTLDPSTRRDGVLRAFLRIREIAKRTGARILVVRMPEGGWLRSGFYAPGHEDTYRNLLCEAAADLPFIDLREFLGDEEFFDWSHPTHSASLRLSAYVADEIARLDAGRELESAADCSERGDRSD
ncbi:MAG: hypothetical protein FJ091_06745 [Deltaproteobacteria bacterium]|nr:hypothetical protein [Deltaproteobacteria bacterium]